MVPQYLSPDEEKAALRRYEEAKRAVDRIQNSGYKSLSDHTGASLAPVCATAFEEKEVLRKKIEERDNAAQARGLRFLSNN